LSGNPAASPIRPLQLRTPQEARIELERIGVDPAGIARMLPKLEHHALLLQQLRPPAANILKQEMLALGGDAAVARGTVSCSVAATDVLLMGTRRQLRSLAGKLDNQPFGLKGIGARLLELLERLQLQPEVWQTSRRKISLQRPLVMGILNVTPDSFSDGGRYNDLTCAIDRAHQLVEEGADLLDIGGESTRPGAPLITEEEELRRVLPVVEALADAIAIPISVDTWKSQVAAAVLAAGAEIINDISGLTFDPAMAAVCAQQRAGVVLMHTRGTPQTMQQQTGYVDLLGELSAALTAAAETALAAGIGPQQIVLDPGIGFGKDSEGNLEILRRLQELTSLGYPLLVGTSRKAFIGKLLGREEPLARLHGTSATTALAVAAGAKILRVHDVQAMKDVALMAHAISTPPTRNR